jgi:hypothetical protein
VSHSAQLNHHILSPFFSLMEVQFLLYREHSWLLPCPVPLVISHWASGTLEKFIPALLWPAICFSQPGFRLFLTEEHHTKCSQTFQNKAEAGGVDH